MMLLLQDPGGAQIGFLLGSLGVTVALSSEMTTKTLPKEENKDHIVHFRGENFHLIYVLCMGVRVCLYLCVLCSDAPIRDFADILITDY